MGKILLKQLGKFVSKCLLLFFVSEGKDKRHCRLREVGQPPPPRPPNRMPPSQIGLEATPLTPRRAPSNFWGRRDGWSAPSAKAGKVELKSPHDRSTNSAPAAPPQKRPAMRRTGRGPSPTHFSDPTTKCAHRSNSAPTLNLFHMCPLIQGEREAESPCRPDPCGSGLAAAC